MFYAKSTNGFYDRNIHGDSIPADAVEITEKEHADLLEGQSLGKVIKSDADGRPYLADRPPLTPEQIAAAAKASRAAAYAKEADPLFFQAQRGEATMEEWKAKVAEIRARYPDGVLPAQ